MSKAKTEEERHFYITLCIKESYSARELDRQINSGYYERYMLSKCSTYLDIAVNDVQGMAELMKNKLRLPKFEIVNDSHIHLYERMEEASAISKEAILGGLELRSIESHSIELEDYYMNLIGGVSHA